MVIFRISKTLKKSSLSSSILISFAILTSTLFLSASKACLADAYYVAPNGSDRNDGSLSAP